MPRVSLPVLSRKEQNYDVGPRLMESRQNPLMDRTGDIHSDPVTEEDLPGGDSTDTNTSDEFDWDEEDGQSEHVLPTRAKRGRAVYMAFLRLASPLRILLLCLIGVGILITPLLVVELRFKTSVVRPHVFAWSLWFSVVWAAGCITYAVVDMVPRLVIGLVVLFGGQVERLKMQIEVRDGLLTRVSVELLGMKSTDVRLFGDVAYSCCFSLVEAGLGYIMDLDRAWRHSWLL
jgi:hypothetical protein